jgi:uncharacterized BrkB/YihY/UPF0761 family membrane protein
VGYFHFIKLRRTVRTSYDRGVTDRLWNVADFVSSWEAYEQRRAERAVQMRYALRLLALAGATVLGVFSLVGVVNLTYYHIEVYKSFHIFPTPAFWRDLRDLAIVMFIFVGFGILYRLAARTPNKSK